MGQILAKEMLERLRQPAAALMAMAVDEARTITDIGEGADAESTEAAVAVNAITMVITTIMQIVPLSDLGMVVALASAYGTVLGSAAPEHRKQLHAAFQAQGKACLAEMVAARMLTVGNA